MFAVTDFKANQCIFADSVKRNAHVYKNSAQRLNSECPILGWLGNLGHSSFTPSVIQASASSSCRPLALAARYAHGSSPVSSSLSPLPNMVSHSYRRPRSLGIWLRINMCLNLVTLVNLVKPVKGSSQSKCPCLTIPKHTFFDFIMLVSSTDLPDLCICCICFAIKYE